MADDIAAQAAGAARAALSVTYLILESLIQRGVLGRDQAREILDGALFLSEAEAPEADPDLRRAQRAQREALAALASQIANPPMRPGSGPR